MHQPQQWQQQLQLITIAAATAKATVAKSSSTPPIALATTKAIIATAAVAAVVVVETAAVAALPPTAAANNTHYKNNVAGVTRAKESKAAATESDLDNVVSQDYCLHIGRPPSPHECRSHCRGEGDVGEADGEDGPEAGADPVGAVLLLAHEGEAIQARVPQRPVNVGGDSSSIIA